MFTILVEGPQGKQRFELSELPVTIGRDSENAIVLLHGAVDRRHARIDNVAGNQVVIDQHSKSGTYVNGARVVARRVLARDEKITIGPYTLVVVPPVEPARLEAYRAADDTEAELLADVIVGDAAGRLVYADWLEDRGDTDRAELLRLQNVAGTKVEVPERTANRLAELAERTDVSWRALVSRPSIESCFEFEFACPKDWGSLTPTDEPGVRHCDACDQHVYYCVDVPEARLHAKRDECVALDLRAKRLKNDLAGPFDRRMCPRCDLDIGPAENCPRCGAAVRERMMMMLGRIKL